MNDYPTNDHDLLVRMDERVAHLHGELLGVGGNPGRMAKVEQRVDKLEDQQSGFKGWIAGACFVLALVWAGIVWLFRYFKI